MLVWIALYIIICLFFRWLIFSNSSMAERLGSWGWTPGEFPKLCVTAYNPLTGE